MASARSVPSVWPRMWFYEEICPRLGNFGFEWPAVAVWLREIEIEFQFGSKIGDGFRKRAQVAKF